MKQTPLVFCLLVSTAWGGTISTSDGNEEFRRIAGSSFSTKPYSLEELDEFIKVEKLSDRTLIVRIGVTSFETVTAISTKKGIVMIDGGMNPPVTEKFRRIVEQEFQRTDFAYLINTHSDDDHTFGDSVFREAVVIGHEKVREELKKRWAENYYSTVFNDLIEKWNTELISVGENSNRGKQLRIYLYEGIELLSNIADNFVLPLPSITFNDKISLDMGDVSFQLVYFGKAHQESDILIYVPEERILFVGDLFSPSGSVGFTNIDKTSVERWYTVLSTILQPGNEIDYVVNGHNGSAMEKEVLTVFFENVKNLWEEYRSDRR